MRKQASRLLIAGTGSGCGKTTVVCALLQALKNRGADVMSFKCGPDYIDPMFHSEIIGADSVNVDLFLAGEETAKRLFVKHARDLNIIEGVMGYYDGLTVTSAEASSWDVGRTLDAPVVLVVNGRGMALSVAAVVKGFQVLRPESGIRGVILNRVSPMTYPQLKAAIEAECGVRVYGYLPACEASTLESRHLGLVTAQEVQGLREKLQTLAAQAEKSVDIDALIGLMRGAAEMEAEETCVQPVGHPRIAVAKDRAFCFYYRDNLELLRDLGAELVEFSPLHDACLPECDGLYLGGGYPELYAEALSANQSMRESVKAAVLTGLPTVAECGGYMYLTERIGEWQMCGVLPGGCANKGRLTRFGYAALRADAASLLFAPGEETRVHEFHYWDSDLPGEALQAVKPSGRSWRCAWTSDTLYAGYPHLYFYSNVRAAERFVRRCAARAGNDQ